MYLLISIASGSSQSGPYNKVTMAALNFCIHMRLSLLEHAYIVYGRCGVYNSIASHLARKYIVYSM